MLGAAVALGISAVGAVPALAITPGGTVTGTFTVPANVPDPADVDVELVGLDGYYVTSATVSGIPSAASYQFTNVVPGQYYVYFTDGFSADNVQPDYYGDNGVDNIHSAAVVTVTSGGTSSLNGDALKNGATITGTVSDANTASEADAYVSAYMQVAGASPDPNLYRGAPVDLTNGTYTISGLPPGTYTINYGADSSTTPAWSLSGLTLGSSGLSYNYGQATTYPIAAGSSTTINFGVPALSTISGTVSSANGPLPGDSVTIYDLDGDYIGSTNTAADGTYSFVVLPGTYKLQYGGFSGPNLTSTWYGGPTEAQAAGVAVGPGATDSNVNVTLGSGATITGTVVSAQGGTPLGDMEVDLVDAQGLSIATYYTLPNGTYAISDVPTGTWYVRFDAGQAYSGLFYAQQFYGGTQTEFGATPVQVTSAGQTVSNINGALLPLGVSALGLPTESGGALSGLHNNKVALKFNVTAGKGAGYLKTLTVGLPKGFSWNSGQLSADLSLGAGVAYTDTITNGDLVITLTSGQPSVAFSLKPHGIVVTKAIEKAAGGLATKPKKHKKHKKPKDEASAAKAKKKKPVKAKDTIKSETIQLTVSDTTGTVTSLPFTVNKPH